MKAINPSGLWKKRLGDWALNPYVGCEHGCFHCYVPTMPGSALFSGPVIDENGVRHDKPPARKQTDWGDYIFLKAGFVDALASELHSFTPEIARERAYGNRGNREWWEPGWILVSFLTDCYTHLEGKLKATRQCLELLLAAGHKVRIQTRSVMVQRDFDLLARYPGQVLLGTSLPYRDDDVARVLEPKSSSPTARIRMLGEAVRAGIPCYVAVAPLMPWTERKELLELFAFLADFGVLNPSGPRLREVFCEVLNPKGENLEMMKAALWKATEQNTWNTEQKRRFTLAHLKLIPYDEEKWAERTCAVGRMLANNFPTEGDNSATAIAENRNVAPGGPRFIFWPDSSRRWATKIDTTRAEFLDQFLPPKA